MQSAPTLIAFDLDGTLVDSVPDIAWAVAEMSRTLGRPVPAVEQVRTWVGDGVSRLVKRALTGTREGEPDVALFESGLQAFRAAYRQHLAVGTRPYPHAETVLQALQDAGVQLACITNKAAEFTHPLLQAFDLERYFALVLSGDSLPRHKPDPLPLQYAAEQLRVAAARCCMVGDSANDMLAARAAGFAAIGARYGYGRLPLEPAPDALLDSLAELPAVLEKWPPGVVRG